MSFKIKIENKQLRSFESKMKSVPSSLPKFLKQGLHQKAIEIKDEARDVVSKDTGRLKNSIQEFDSSTKNKIKFIVQPQEKYAEGVEKGREPHEPNMTTLKKWAKRKGLNPYAVANAIRKKGTKKHPYMQPSYKKIKPTIEPFIGDIVRNFLKKYL